MRCVHVRTYMRATAAVPPLREIKFHKMWWMPVCLQSQLWESACPCITRLSAHFCVSMCTNAWSCDMGMFTCLECLWHYPEGWVMLGEVPLGSGMLWVGLVIIVAVALVPTNQANKVWTRKMRAGQQSQIVASRGTHLADYKEACQEKEIHQIKQKKEDRFPVLFSFLCLSCRANSPGSNSM